MELRHLHIFLTVAEELHFTRAAARLQTAQPALSRQIRHLERELGVELFDRTNRSVKLTDAGHVFLEHARRVVDDADRAKEAAQQAARGNLGRLDVGFVPFAGTEVLPELLIAYRARHPLVKVKLHELHTAPQIDALVNGEIHLGLLVHRIDEPRLQTKLLQRQPLVVAMSASHPLASRRSLRLIELASERWIAGPGYASILYAACAKAGFVPVIAEQAVGQETRLLLVASGAGLALTGKSVPRPPGRRIAYRPLSRPRITVDLVVAWANDPASPLVNGFLDIALSTFGPTATQQP